MLAMAFLNLYCNQSEPKDNFVPYLNHNDTVKYVGKQACKNCHPGIYQSFMETGMGQSFGRATQQKSAADFSRHQVVFDSIRNFGYYPHWLKDTLYITEFRLEGKDTIYKRTERVDYIIGSGQHTNSHLTSINGFIYQLPLTWYAQKGKWDLPPGFENGRNVRFSRAIEFECMSCHNAMPEIEKGSVNKFVKIPDGIDCERCHGPGEVHVSLKLKGVFVDTVHLIDYSIVNPRKLSWQRQIDLCQRCHLQGNSVLKEGKKFSDFKPGMKLSDVYEVYMPQFEKASDDFIMASHAQRLQQSKCFIESNKEVKKVEGKSFTTMNLTCITCHNPHVSVKTTGTQVFNNACINCHRQDACDEEEDALKLANNNCVSCHMPKSGSVDIPHVSVHDHKIKIPVAKDKQDNIKKIIGLYCINAKETNADSKANAFLGYYERFEGGAESIDSSLFWAQSISDLNKKLSIQIHAYYLQNNWDAILSLANNLKISKENDPWLLYRVGQAYQNLNQFENAFECYLIACKLSPNNLSFQTKLGIIFIQLNKFDEAIVVLKNCINKQPKQADAWVNLGFAYLNLKNQKSAMNAYNRALSLDPDHAQALLNRAALFHLQKQDVAAYRDLICLQKLDPKNAQVKLMLYEIQQKMGSSNEVIIQ